MCVFVACVSLPHLSDVACAGEADAGRLRLIKFIAAFQPILLFNFDAWMFYYIQEK